MSDDGSNPRGGRVTLAIAGLVVFLLGGAGLGYSVTYPSAAGAGTYGLSAVLGVVGAIAVLAAVYNPDALQIGERTSPSEAELHDRRVDDSFEDE